jgi:SAM-dependent methyltransferase
MKIADSLRLYSSLLLFRLQGGSPRQYRQQWDSYWRSIRKTGADGEVLWDNLPEKASAEDLVRFQRHLTASDLPLLDLGCGNGRQTRFLARHFERVVGVDVAPAAVALARRETLGTMVESRVSFALFDGANPGEAEALHDRLGDVNIYMRTVFHCVQTADRPAFVRALDTLLGERGTLYQIELSQGALETFRRLPGDSPSGLPHLVHNVVRNGIHPIGFSAADRETYYPDDRWVVLDQGDGVDIKTVRLTHGAEALVPANYMVVRPRRPAVPVSAASLASATAAATVGARVDAPPSRPAAHPAA